ncbi:hypothetical protein EG359_05035 [Chryseobacterium joostei]|nr:hypothetical protein [Chryseobacterium joostei]AZA99007.1 hypothetical protein EG359_05035 [Chryseobacterium joostei]
MKNIIIIFFLFASCYACKKNETEGLFAQKAFANSHYNRFHIDNYYRYYKKNETNGIEYDTFRPIIYTNVRPFKENEKYPEQIFDPFGRAKDSRKYFARELNQTFVAYITKDNKLIYRNFFRDYHGPDYYIKSIDKPRNLNDLTKYLSNLKLSYKILDTIKRKPITEKDKLIDSLITSKTYNIMVNNYFYRVTLDSAFCETQLYYHPRDTTSIFRTIIIHTF